MSQMSVEQRPFCRRSLAQKGARHESEFHFFYGHGPKAGDYAMLSNFFELKEPFQDGEGNLFLTSEHYMMYAKAILFKDLEMSQLILDCASPLEAKALGRKVRGFDKDVWAANCLHIVANGCELKFSQSKECKAVLLGTGDKMLVESAPRDRIWGIGMGKSNPKRLDPNCWNGENLLGEALMIARERLIAASKNS